MKQIIITGTLAALILISTLLGCSTPQYDESVLEDVNKVLTIYIRNGSNVTSSHPIVEGNWYFKDIDKIRIRTANQSDTILIASWNIQTFGQTKAAKPEVMAVIAQTIAQFDIVAIQEIRDKSGTAIKELEREIDSLGTDYDVIIGPLLGRTQSKEQYAILYRTDTFEVGHTYTFDDQNDYFHREPLVAHFKVKEQRFDFVLMDFHLDPDEVATEFESLNAAYYDAANKFKNSHELDYLMVGDFNLDCSYFEETLLAVTEWEYLITNDMDTNLADSSCTYDRIITTDDTLEDWTGTAGVYRFDTIHGLTNEQAKQVSDHYPVYAEFHAARDTD